MKYNQVFGRPTNTTKLLGNRCYFDVEPILEKRMQSADQFMKRLDMEAVLSGHQGCVNRLEWSANGRLLASASDDTHVMIWDAFRHRCLSDLQTPHQGNIFAVKFLPNTNDCRVATGAADFRLFVFDVERGGGSPLWKCVCHQMRVKSLATSHDSPNLLWTSGEEGVIFQFDLREPHVCHGNDNILLVNLNNHIGPQAEIKSIAINPRRPELLAVGANDTYARLYDRRMLSLRSMVFAPVAAHGSYDGMSNMPLTSADDNIPTDCVTYFSPGQFVQQRDRLESMHKAITHLTFSPDGTELLVNMGAEQIYLYDINNAKKAEFLKLPSVAAGGEPSSRKNIALPPHVETLKKNGNHDLDRDEFLQAINQYTAAIRLAPNYPVLYLNRATGLMRRNWYGDVYAALRDCIRALHLDPTYIKAHFRLARALLLLGHRQEASDALDALVKRFPGYVPHKNVLMLRKDINSAIEVAKQNDESNSFDSSVVASEKEMHWRRLALDYDERFVGHCNTTTDIKEASFFGNDANYIIAGSDDGNFFIWERLHSKITSVFKGDEAIVNCVQPHPSVCLLATSGIDQDIRLWSPQPELDDETDAVPARRLKLSTFDGAVLSNQHRMQQDPFVASCRTS